MNIAILINSLESGGAQKVVLDLCYAFKKAGDNVNLILLYKNNIYEEPLDINIIYLMNSIPNNKIHKFTSIFRLARKLKKVIKDIENKGKIDLFFSHLPFSNYVAWLANVKNHFAVIHNTYSKIYTSTPERRIISLIHRNKKLITVSKGIKMDLIKNFNLDENHIKVIYNPFNIERIKILSKEKINYNKPYIIHVGRFSKQKRHDILLKAYKETKLKEYYDLLLLGDGEERETINNLIKALNLKEKVKLLGWQKNPYKWIKNASLLVLSSDYEGLPTVLIESLICNTPIVSTDCESGPKEIMVGELRKYLAKVGDYKDLAKKMDLAIKDYPKIKESYYEKFRIENVVLQYKALKDEL